jgi:hypothetical protein
MKMLWEEDILTLVKKALRTSVPPIQSNIVARVSDQWSESVIKIVSFDIGWTRRFF